jgi:lysozyme
VLNANPPGPGALIGVDVSHFQQNIDWTLVGASGINYCFIKATEGLSREDEKFARNWQAASDAGIMRGAYHFFQPAESVTAQADFFLRTVNQLPANDLPPVLDLEDAAAWANIPPEDRAALTVEWLQAVEQGLNATPLVYLSPAFAAETLANSPLLARFPVWLAEYTSAPAPSVPKPWEAWTFWQYTDQGTTPGIVGFVDHSRFNGTIEELRALKSR